MFTIKHALEFQPRGTVSGPFDESAVQLPETLATPKRTACDTDLLSLDSRKVAVIRSKHRVTITCVEGVLWITEDGNLNDMLVKSGESFQSSGSRCIAITACGRSTYRTTVEPTPWWSRPGRAVADALSLTVRVRPTSWHASQSD